MNAYARPSSPYGTEDIRLRPQRSVEYEALARTTRRLASVASQRETDFPLFVAALHENVALWRLLAGFVADPGNALPEALRARLFYLFEFVEQHTAKVMDQGASLEILIEINTAVMRGLRGQGGRS